MSITLVLVVFAGGPHTAPRLEVAENALAFLKPDIVFLTGAEFLCQDESGRVPTERFKCGAPDINVITDDASTTLASCVQVARTIRQQFREPVRVTAITSNYHAPRARWLLEGLLPRNCSMDWLTSPDLLRSNWSATPRARRLIRGEIVSWLYCGPVGLIFRPLPTALTLACCSALALDLRRLGRARAGATAPPSTP